MASDIKARLLAEREDLTRKLAECEADLADVEGRPTGPAILLDLVDAVALNAPRSPVSTGIAPLDHILSGGIARGEALAIAGGPGSFKTTTACYMTASLATDKTAVLFVAADEPSNRVARKIGTRYGERWSELCSDYPPALDRLREKLRGAFIRITHPQANFVLEEVLDAFDREAPKDRQRIVILDHLHSVEPRGGGGDDTERAVIERVVSVLIDRYVRPKEWSLFALSEVTKSALSVVPESPLMSFAGTRKIASRFDAALLMTPDRHEPRRVRVIPAKNRFGPRQEFTLEWDTERWVPVHIPEDDIEAARAATKSDRTIKADEADETLVLEAVRKASTSIKKSDIPDRVGGKAARARAALLRLLDRGVLKLERGPAGPTGGVRPEVVIEVTR